MLKVNIVQPSQKRIAIVIPTIHSRLRIIEMHLENLAKIEKVLKPYVLIVVSTDKCSLLNSIEETLKLMRRNLPKLDISWIILCPDYGPATAYYIGMKFAYRMGFNSISLADDDVIPVDENFISKLAEYSQKYGVVQPYNVDAHSWLLTNHYKTIRRDIIERAGYIDPIFIKSFDDIEYHIRIELCSKGRIKNVMLRYRHPPSKASLINLGDIYLSARNFGLLVSRHKLCIVSKIIGARRLQSIVVYIIAQLLPLLLALITNLVGYVELFKIFVKAQIAIIRLLMVLSKKKVITLDAVKKDLLIFKTVKSLFDRNIKLVNASKFATHRMTSLPTLTINHYLSTYAVHVTGNAKLYIVGNRIIHPIKVIRILRKLTKQGISSIKMFIPPNYPLGIVSLVMTIMIAKFFSKIKRVIIPDPASEHIIVLTMSKRQKQCRKHENLRKSLQQMTYLM